MLVRVLDRQLHKNASADCARTVSFDRLMHCLLGLYMYVRSSVGGEARCGYI